MKTRYTAPSDVRPSYASEHRRMKPVLETARRLDVGNNPTAQALYEAGSAGFQIWCSPTDNPGGKWQEVRMFPGAFAKPVEYLASVHWQWEDEAIVGLELSTCAYALADRFPQEFSASLLAQQLGKQSIRNREDDLAWAMRKIRELFRLACVPMPAVNVIDD